MYCPKCDSTAFNKYCYRCGTKLVSNPACNWCGRVFASYDKYCEGCGRSKKEATTTSPPSIIG